MNDDPWLAWSVTAAEAPSHPGVERLAERHQCQGLVTSRYSFKKHREGSLLACKVSALWRFEALPDDRYGAQSGIYCWKHLVYQGMCGAMNEEQRTRDWLTALRGEKA